ncbi:type IV pilus assembly protein FimV [Undibacterium sp. SXout11W]|uniref:type IV pilus assembly protein FimV n=1 Tax=Undibacterium sp. SXout11W TaxID=3413050 RepID=UPI003BF4123E
MDDAHALGMGGLRIQSSLGQQLRAQLDVTGVDIEDLDVGCFRASIESPEGILLSNVDVRIASQGGAKFLVLGTRKNIHEPAVKVIVHVSCDVQLHREYMILLDPPEISGSAPNVVLPSLERTATTAKVAQLKNEKLVVLPRPFPEKLASRQKTEIVSDLVTVKKNTKKLRLVGKASESSNTRDSLKLSDEPELLPQGLKLADTITARADDKSSDASAELRLAQMQYAAMMRGEDVPRVVPGKLESTEQKNQLLLKESSQLKRQIQQDKSTIEDLKENSIPKTWFYLLLLLVAGALAVAGVLIAYIKRVHKKTSSTWWEQKEAKPAPDTKLNIEELVNSVQASYGPTTTSVPSDSTESILRPALGAISTQSKVKPPIESPLGGLDAPSVFGRNYTPSLEDTNSSTFNFFSSRTNSVKVEEISDVTQEAEFWMSVNDPERAIEILEPQAELDHPESPVPWLYLLDLYRVVGNKDKYDPLRDRFVVFFNANVPEFEIDPATLPTRHLDDFEHLSKKICSMWNTNEILPFLESLLIDDRDGKRMGFELPVYRDILLLISIANELERQKSMGEIDRGRNYFTGSASSVAVHKPHEEDGNVINFETIDFENKSNPG